MASHRVTVRSPLAAVDAFAYLSDLRNFAEWDPGVRRVDQVEGDGGGSASVFDVTVAGVGRDVTLRYRTVSYVAPESIVVEATNRFVTSTDRITVVAAPAGCEVIYDAGLRLNGLLSVFDVVAKAILARVVPRAAVGLRRVLRVEAPR